MYSAACCAVCGYALIDILSSFRLYGFCFKYQYPIDSLASFREEGKIDYSIPAGVMVRKYMGSWPLISSLIDLRRMLRTAHVIFIWCLPDICASGVAFWFNNQYASPKMHTYIRVECHSKQFVC